MDAILKKSDIIEQLKELPDEVTLDELIDTFIFVEKVKKGLQSADGAQLTSHEAVKGITEEWSK